MLNCTISTVAFRLSDGSDCIQVLFNGGAFYFHGTYAEMREFTAALNAEIDLREATDAV